MKRLAPILVPAVAVLLLVMWAFLIFLPEGKKISDKKKERDQLVLTGQSLQAEVTRLKALQANEPQLEALKDTLSQEIPDQPDLAGFIQAANTLAQSSGITWLSITPSEPTAGSGGVSTINISMQMDGNFHAILNYLNGLLPPNISDFSRLVVVNALTLESSAAASTFQSPTLSVTITGSIYTTFVPTAAGATASAGSTAGSTAGNTGPSAAAPNGNS